MQAEMEEGAGERSVSAIRMALDTAMLVGGIAGAASCLFLFVFFPDIPRQYLALAAMASLLAAFSSVLGFYVRGPSPDSIIQFLAIALVLAGIAVNAEVVTGFENRVVIAIGLFLSGILMFGLSVFADQLRWNRMVLEDVGDADQPDSPEAVLEEDGDEGGDDPGQNDDAREAN